MDHLYMDDDLISSFVLRSVIMICNIMHVIFLRERFIVRLGKSSGPGGEDKRVRKSNQESHRCGKQVLLYLCRGKGNRNSKSH